MTAKYFNVKFISPNDPGYVAFGNRYNNKMRISERREKDPFVSDYQKALRKWEYVIRSLLSKLVNEDENRILKYSEHNVGIRYREIDFIAKPELELLILCEIKLKEKYTVSLSSKQSGWTQLNKSMQIASIEYSNLGGLSICIDMSHIYGLESSARLQDYCNFSDISNYLSSQSQDKVIIWLNGMEIARLATQHGLLTDCNISRMKKLFCEQNNPMSVLKGRHKDDIHNNPFKDILRNLKSK